MTQTRPVILLVAFSLLCGCSEQRTTSRQASKARRSRTAAKGDSRGKEVAGPKNTDIRVVRAAHVENIQDPAPLAGKAPSLLGDDAGQRQVVGNAAMPHEASLALGEAVKALRTKLAVISHNLANADTIGFKSGRVTLEDCGYRRPKLPGAQDAFNNYAPTGIEVGQGCRVQSVAIDFRQGPIGVTDRELDVAIEGDGFFQLIDPTTNNFVYTRAGNFAVNSNGIVAIGSSNTGRIVQPQISIPLDTQAIVISAEGNVSIQQLGQTQFSQIGQFQLAKFLNPEGLLRLGENIYQETLASGAAVFGQPGTNGLGVLRQNALERSNVDFDEEILAWKATHRSLRAIERLGDDSLPR